MPTDVSNEAPGGSGYVKITRQYLCDFLTEWERTDPDRWSVNWKFTNMSVFCLINKQEKIHTLFFKESYKPPLVNFTRLRGPRACVKKCKRTDQSSDQND